jgi:hypothetical protein
MHNKFALKKKTTILRNRLNFIDEHCIIFSIFFCFVICHESQTWNPMVIEKISLTHCMHIDFIQSSPSNLGPSLILIQSELWIPKCYRAHSKVLLLLCLRFPKDAIKILGYYLICYTSMFLDKSGSLLLHFHPMHQ